MGRISGELDKQMVSSSFDLLLVDETSRYVFRILAAKEIFKSPYKYGFVLRKDNLYPAVRTKKVEVSTDILDLAVFAKQNGVSYAQLKDFNIWLRDRSLKMSVKNPRRYIIDIPVVDDLYYSKNKMKAHDNNWIMDGK